MNEHVRAEIQEIQNWNKYLSIINPTLKHENNKYKNFKVGVTEYALLRARVLYTYENILHTYGMRQYIGCEVPAPETNTAEFCELMDWCNTHKNLLGL